MEIIKRFFGRFSHRHAYALAILAAVEARGELDRIARNW